MFNKESYIEMKSGLELFNAEKFWECHEELEDVWAEYMHSPFRFIHWAIIQVATSLYHARDGNIAGAHGMLEKAKEKIKKCEENYLENDLLDKYLNWKKFKDLVYSIKAEDNLEKFDELYHFKFPELKDE